MTEYRAAETEIEAAQLARELLQRIGDIQWRIGDDDPLRRAFQVAHRALVLGLWVSPVLRVGSTKTLFEAQFPHGEDALTRVEAQGVASEEALQTLYERALNVPAGRAAPRKFLVVSLVAEAQHLLAVLRSETKEGVVLSPESTPERLQEELDNLCAIRHVSDFGGAASLPKFLFSSAAHVAREVFLRYGTELHIDAVMRALAGLIQDDERLRQANRTDRLGRRPEGDGGIGHLDAVLKLLVSAGLQPALALDDRPARAKAMDTIGRELSAARKR